MKHYELKSWYFSRWAVSTRTKRVLFSVGLSRHPRVWTVYSFSQNPWTLWNHQSPSHIWVSNTVQPCSTNTPTWCKISNWPHQTALMAIGLAWPLIFQHVHPHQRPQRPHLKAAWVSSKVMRRTCHEPHGGSAGWGPARNHRARCEGMDDFRRSGPGRIIEKKVQDVIYRLSQSEQNRTDIFYPQLFAPLQYLFWSPC